MSNRWNPNPTHITAVITIPFVAAFNAIHRHIQSKSEKDQWALGLPFLLIGCYLPYLLGVHHNPACQIFSGIFFGLIGAGLSAILNYRKSKKE